jgi:predicted nucleotide-binding protein
MDSDLDLLKALLDEGRAFTFDNFSYRAEDEYKGQFGGEDTPEWMAWKTRSMNAVQRLSSEGSAPTLLVKEAMTIRTDGNGPDRFERAKATLLTALEMVNSAMRLDSYGELRTAESRSSSPLLSNRVFVVHGHDVGLKIDVERFLREIGLEPVVLHRQPDQGATIIEKFEKHSDVGYAFILLTPDEMAFTVDQKDIAETDRSIELRARPNVIFEFGYFVGRLGRDRVCCLCKGSVTVPSDLSGLVYKRVDDGLDAQAYAIIRELRAAGYDIRV